VQQDADEDVERAPLRPKSLSNDQTSSLKGSSHHSGSSCRSDHSDRTKSSRRSGRDFDDETHQSLATQSQSSMIKEPSKAQMKSILQEENLNDDEQMQNFEGLTIPESKPIADFFPHCTVMFADIVGFNAWSSSRDPIQVFTLLQNVYEEFDKAAKTKGVFKVETIGDSYVAVTGLPESQDDHAIIMSSFALECRKIMKDVTQTLERELGPDTADDLSLRIGLHSGPVTAGLLRGEKSRFQLFGDTVNTASRMESSGEENLIQLSSSTAKFLEEGGKGDWLLKREGGLVVQGTVETETFWLERKDSASGRRLSMDAAYNAFQGKTTSKKQKKDSLLWSATENVGPLDSTDPKSSKGDSSDSVARLVDWNVEILSKLLRQVVSYLLLK
jgi:class 3 adenylate cyclase